jgi:hypothetical protein
LSNSPTQKEIELRAYEIYLRRGTTGDPLTDWLTAEKELLERYAVSTEKQKKVVAVTAGVSGPKSSGSRRTKSQVQRS